MERTPASYLVRQCERALCERWGYVWGGKGEFYTRELAEAWARVEREGKSASYYLEDCRRWFDRCVADCSGLICMAIRQFTSTDYDQNSYEMQASFSTFGPIECVPEILGLILWKPGHVAIYTGCATCIEAKCTAEGVVRSPLEGRGFTTWGMLPAIDYAPMGTTLT